uniref:Uncharacterized protein n=1 Tax=Anopheles culicifacies TaxID=139723 RepID=A0A182MF55_9DIPT
MLAPGNKYTLPEHLDVNVQVRIRMILQQISYTLSFWFGKCARTTECFRRRIITVEPYRILPLVRKVAVQINPVVVVALWDTILAPATIISFGVLVPIGIRYRDNDPLEIVRLRVAVRIAEQLMDDVDGRRHSNPLACPQVRYQYDLPSLVRFIMSRNCLAQFHPQGHKQLRESMGMKRDIV